MKQLPREIISEIISYTNDSQRLSLFYTSVLFREFLNKDFPLNDETLLLFVKLANKEQIINGLDVIVAKDKQELLLTFINYYERKYRYSGFLTSGELSSKLRSLARGRDNADLRKFINQHTLLWYNYACVMFDRKVFDREEWIKRGYPLNSSTIYKQVIERKNFPLLRWFYENGFVLSSPFDHIAQALLKDMLDLAKWLKENNFKQEGGTVSDILARRKSFDALEWAVKNGYYWEELDNLQTPRAIYEILKRIIAYNTYFDLNP